MKMTPEKLSIVFENGELKTKGGTFWFCGAFIFGKPGDNFYSLESITYNAKENALEIVTSHGVAKILNPKEIVEEKGYGSFRIKMKGDLVSFQYEWESKINKLEYTLLDKEAKSIHDNGHIVSKRPFDDNSVIFEFGE